MTMLIEPPPVETERIPPAVPPSTDGTPGAERPKHHPWRWVLVALVVVALVAGGIAVAVATTVPNAQYDRAVADLDATKQQLSASQDDVARLTAELAAMKADAAALQEQVSTLEDEAVTSETERQQVLAQVDQLQASVARAMLAAEAVGLFALDLNPEWVAQLELAGLDESEGDALLADLGRGSWTVRDWLQGFGEDPWGAVDRAIVAIGDQQLTDLWDRWSYSEVGTDEEGAAYLEFQWRLMRLLVEPLLEATATS